MKCSFCGAEFTEAREKCASCPLHKSCSSTCCPNCGYELTRESKLVDMARGVLSRLNHYKKTAAAKKGSDR